ncbi:MAG: tetratricopeptide repeat protein [Myxococcota bacterium]
MNGPDEPEPEPTKSRTERSHGEALRRARPHESLGGLRALEGIRGRLFGRAAAPIRVGRYVLGERLGAGGLGVVHAAHDPQLDREVAIKLLRPGLRGDRSREESRLLREGQAIARLSHPNVVEVFDVGTYELPRSAEATGLPRRGVFVVMARLEGQTLEAWLERRPRSWPEVLEVMRAAGQGLVAAHAAGLVHRDFKPANIFVEHDGWVRVLDFGLARPEGPSRTTALIPVAGASVELAESITRTGAVLGTPAYMAPEQHRGCMADARSDQYSFCATLYRGLYGVLPFEGSDLDALDQAKQARALVRPERELRVPRWLRAVMLRGLSPSPRERWPSMRALLRALSAERGARRGRTAVAVGGGVLGLGLVGATFVSTPRTRCEGTASWTAEARAAVEQALSGHEVGSGTVLRVTERLDAYANAWVRERHALCEVTISAPDDPILDRRMSCLRQRQAHFDALVELLRDADAEVATRAPAAVAQLPVLEVCADVELLRVEQGPPVDPAAAHGVEVLRARISEVSARVTAGKIDHALALAEQLPGEAEALGVPSVLAEAQWWEGHVRRIAGDLEGAMPRLEAASMTGATHGHDKVAALAAVELTIVLNRLARYDEALEWARHAEAAALRFGEGRYPEARAYVSKGHVLRSLGQAEEAYALYERAMVVQQRADPGSHELPTILNNLGTAALTMGRYSEAHQHYENSHARLVALLGHEHPQTTGALMNLAITTAGLGRHAAAHQQFLSARESFVRLFGPEDPRVAQVDTNFADLLLDMGQLDQGRDRFAAARDLFARTLGPSHPNTATARAGWGRAQLRLGNLQPARGAIEQALADLREALGPEQETVAVTLGHLGQVDLAQGDRVAARQRLGEAADLLERLGADKGRRLEPRFHLARLRWEEGEYAVARAQAQQIYDALATEPSQGPARAEIVAWLHDHPLP